MPQAPDISIVDSDETVLVGWDYTNLLPTNVKIAAINSTSCAVHSGTDPAAVTRLQGAAFIKGNTVVRSFAPRVPGVVYILTSVVRLDDGEVMSIWFLAPCGTPA